ncbi:MAG TPA: hypothetical protein VHP36_08210 [Chitinispirillaceae bacterium]|nr:hypothetical protein [Chitinispirillaceae bacterium]
MDESLKNELFRLQPRFLYLEMIFFCVIASFCIISWFPPIFSLLAYETILQSAVNASVLLNITALIFFLLYKFTKNELRRFCIIITDDQIVKKGFSGTNAIRFSDITGLDYIRVPALRGFLKISTADSVLKIPMYIEHPTLFLTSLQSRLNDYSIISANIVGPQLREDVSVFQDSCQRSRRSFLPLIFISLFMFCFNTLIAVQFWDLALIPVLLFAITGLFLPLFAYYIADIKISRSVRNLLRTDSAEIYNSGMEYLHCGLIIFILYLFIGILFKAVFLWYY